MKKINTCILSFLLTLSLSAQQLPVVPPSPEASALFKFSEVPVSYFTGLANTSIPLFDIKSNGVDVPVALSYHGRGVRVEEIAPRVGIGWNLSYGGMISRQVRGLADDAGSQSVTNFYNTVFSAPALAATVYNAYIHNTVDLEPDVFFYDFPGASGKFIINPRDNQILLQNYSDTKVLPILINGKIKGWTVTDKGGDRYYFGLSKDQQRSAYDYDIVSESYSFTMGVGMTALGSGGNQDINTWHLMEIETASNDLVTFTYEAENPIAYKRSYDKVVENVPSSYFSKTVSVQNQVKEITFRDGKVVFTKRTDERLDLPGAYALDKVELFDKKDSLVKQCQFQYFYNNAIQNNNQLTYLKTLDPSSDKRLFLNSVQVKGTKGDVMPPYVFGYSDIQLPNRFSNSQDNWGFYNGKDNGQYLTFFNYQAATVNRQVDTVMSEAGMLRKVVYPTGDSVVFAYEHNRAIPPFFLTQLLFPHNNPNETVPVVHGFFKQQEFYQNGNYVYEFVVGGDKVGPVTFHFELPWCTGDPSDLPSVCGYQVYLDGGTVSSAYLYPPAGDKILNIGPGTYTLTVVPPPGHDVNDYRNSFLADVRWQETRNTSPVGGDNNVLLSAGKRIKRIEYWAQGGKASVKTYAYNDPVTGKTSGKIFGLPNFYFIRDIASISGGAPVVDNYGSLPGSPLTNLQGNSVGYTYVTEFFGDTLINTGKIEYKFTGTEDGGEYYTFPYYPPIDNEWLRGKSLSTKIYKRTNTDYSIIKETTNRYAYAGQQDVEGVFFEPFLPEGQNNVYINTRTNFSLPLMIFHKDTLAPYNYKVYYHTGGVMDLYSTQEKEYSDAGVISKFSNYEFDYNKHYQLKTSSANSSKGETLKTVMTYPQDIANKTPAEQKLVDINQVAAPVKTESFVLAGGSGNVLAKTVKAIQYKDWGNNLVAPELVQSAINNAPLETDIQFYSYDSYGNPTEGIGRDGIRVSYVWGYASRYLVAKVIGSDYNTVKAKLNMTLLSNAHQYSDQAIRGELDKLRSIPSTQVVTYTFAPLVGMTSQTDVNGRTNYYEYDGLGRLKLIKDQDGNILKTYDYHYKTN